MKILFVSTEIPITPEQAGAPRTYCLGRELAKKGHEVHLLIFPFDPLNPDKVQSLELKNVFSAIEINKAVESETSVVTRLKHSFFNLNYRDLQYKNPEYLSRAKEITEKYFTENSLAVIVGFSHASSQFINPKLPSVIDLCDALSLLSLRKMKRINSIIDSFGFLRESISYKNLEKKIGKAFNQVFFVSSIDKTWYQKQTGYDNANVIPLGIDTEYFSPRTKEPSTENIIFTGVIDYEPNRDAVEFALKDIFPLIKSANGNAKLLIVGKHTEVELPPEIDNEGVEFYANVEDVRPYLQQAKVFLCPLRMGAGIKNKVLSAMACRIPIVATPMSIEGMGLVHNVHCLVAKDAKELADCTVLLLKDLALREKLVKAAYQLVLENSWEHSAKLMEDVLVRVKPQR